MLKYDYIFWNLEHAHTHTHNHNIQISSQHSYYLFTLSVFFMLTDGIC